MNIGWMAGLGVMLALVWAPWPAGVAAMGLVSAALGVLWSFGGRSGKVRVPVACAGACLLAGIGCWQLWSGETLYRFGTEVRVAAWASAAWVMFLAANGKGRREELRDWLLWLGLGVAVLGVFHSLTAEGKLWWSLPIGPGMMLFAPFVNADHFAIFLELLSPLAAANLMAGRRMVLSACAIGVMAGAVVATGSRAGSMGMGLVLLVLVGAKAAQGRLDWRTLGVAALALATIQVTGWERVWTKLQAEDQMRTRRELNEVSSRMFAGGKVLGAGLGSWRYAYAANANPTVGGDAEAAHNDWLQAGVEAGWAGIAGFAVMALWCAYRSWLQPWGWGTVLVLGHAAVDFPFQTPALLFAWALLAGLLGSEAGGERVSGRARR